MWRDLLKELIKFSGGRLKTEQTTSTYMFIAHESVKI